MGIAKCGRLGSTTEGGLLQENLLNMLLLVAFSGRDFITGGDRQKTEMVDGIACGDYGIICY